MISGSKHNSVPADPPPAANSDWFIAGLLFIASIAHDVLTLVVGALFIVSLALSFPFAIGLMILAAFGQLGL
jgi:hypothetical protein